MKNWLVRNHALRPLMVVILLIIILVVVRFIYVPGDFGIHGGFTYNWYRQSDIQDWKNVTVKYQGKAYCANCHKSESTSIAASPHSIIQCENCHGPGVGHPAQVPKLTIDTSRELCMRCHTALPYAASGRSKIPGIDPDTHNPGKACVSCHNPHKPLPLPTVTTAAGA